MGDGGDTGVVRSESLTRFQGYAALAYGSKGIMWYCWGRGIWNFTTASPAPIYEAVKEFNLRINPLHDSNPTNTPTTATSVTTDTAEMTPAEAEAAAAAAAAGWQAPLLAYDEWEGVYHTGWAGPAASSHAPGVGEIVTDMDDDLLAGVMTQSAPSGTGNTGNSAHGPTGSDSDTVLLLVVDKRLSTDLIGAPPRNASVTFHPSLIGRIETIPGGDMTVEQGQGATGAPRLTITNLLPGDGRMVILHGTGSGALVARARALRRWRQSEPPSLGVIKTTQYAYYNDYYKDRPHTNMVVAFQAAEPKSNGAGGGGSGGSGGSGVVHSGASGLADNGDVEATVAALAAASFNTVVVPWLPVSSPAFTSSIAGTLNAGLRQGVFVLLSPSSTSSTSSSPSSSPSSSTSSRIMSTAEASAIRSAIGCHPNHAGVVLLGNGTVDPADAAAMSALGAVGSFLRRSASPLYAVVAAATVDEVAEIKSKTGLITVALAVPSASFSSAPSASSASPSPTTRMQAVAAQYAAMFQQRSSPTAISTTRMVHADCRGPGRSSAVTRFQVSAAVAFGASSLIVGGMDDPFTTTTRTTAAATAAADRHGSGDDYNIDDDDDDDNVADGACSLATVAPVTGQLAMWGDRVEGATLMGHINTGWPIAGAAAPGSKQAAALGASVIAMDADLLVAVFAPRPATPPSPHGPPPPLLMIVDKRSSGGPREAVLRFDASLVYGWTAVQGDVGAGFASCNKVVLGPSASVTLSPGGVALITLTLFSP